MRITPLLCSLLLTLSGAVGAQTVGLAGMMGNRALLIVDANPPKSVAPGETLRGVTVISTQGDQAVVEIAGKRHTLRVGDAPASVGTGNAGDSGGSRIVLTAGSGGHFLTSGQINGRTTQMLVDTGATAVAMTVAEAQRIGLNYQAGQPMVMSTANGMVQGWRVQLNSVRIGDVTVHGVEAVVSSGAMPFVLLGNSYLTHFQMSRTNDQMVLEKRY